MSTAWTKHGTFKALLTVMALAIAGLLSGCGATGDEENLGEVSQNLCTGVKLAGTPAGPSAAGTNVTLTASGATCAGGQTAEYRFVYIKDGTSTPVQIRAYAAGASTVWNTTGLASGSYKVLVYARAAGTTSSFDSVAYLNPNYQIGNVCNVTSTFTTTPASPQGVGTPISLTAAATCTGGTAEYRFAYRAPGSANYVYVGAYGASTQTWNTTGLPAGLYSLIAYARAVGNTSTYESFKYSSYSLGAVCSSATISASPASPQPVGTTVNLTGGATCASPQFRFSYRLNGSSTWITIGAGTFGAAMQAWNTTGLASGIYNVLVEARQTGNSGNAETTATINSYALGNTCSTVTLAANPVSPSAVGTQVTLTGAATCSGSATAEYRFSYKQSGDPSYTLLRGYGAATYVWDTSAFAVGAYALFVEARSVGSTGSPESSVVSVYQLTAKYISQLNAGLGNHVCARVNDGTARCWGANDVGQLGNGVTSPSSSTPVTVTGLNTVVAVTSGGYHSCALLSNNTVRCWGENSDGQLGNNTTTASSTAVVASGLTDAVAISAGTYHTCALRTGGGISCWGNNSSLQTGTVAANNKQLVPTAAAGVTTGATAVISGGFHTCAIVSGGAKCWGDNSLGQLGTAGTPEQTKDALAVPGLTSGVTSLGSGDSHVCAVVGGAVQCWGDNTYGQLGNGVASATPTTSPAAVPGLSGVAEIAAGFVFSCARLTAQTVQCWGRNVEGEVGDGTGVDKFVPTAVSGISTATSVSAGSTMACALLTGNLTSCWGYGGLGALGNGGTGDALSPVAVTIP